MFKNRQKAGWVYQLSKVTGNLFCGFLALHYIFQGSFVPAAWLIVLGAVFDKMDGKIARAMGRASQFGIEFDSIVDICTFGLVPAVMIYHTHMHAGWGLVLAFAYLLSGAYRLARFTTISLNDEKGDYYLGLPIPTAAICLTQYVVFTEGTWNSAHAVVLAAFLVLFLAFLMISRFDYDPMPNFRGVGFGERFCLTLSIHLTFCFRVSIGIAKCKCQSIGIGIT